MARQLALTVSLSRAANRVDLVKDAAPEFVTSSEVVAHWLQHAFPRVNTRHVPSRRQVARIRADSNDRMALLTSEHSRKRPRASAAAAAAAAAHANNNDHLLTFRSAAVANNALLPLPVAGGLAVSATTTTLHARLRRTLTLRRGSDVVPLRPQGALLRHLAGTDWNSAEVRPSKKRRGGGGGGGGGSGRHSTTRRFPLLLMWERGSGKTLAVVLAAFQCPPGDSDAPVAAAPRRVVIVCSNTLIGQWEAALRRIPCGAGCSHISIVGYTYFKAHGDDLCRRCDLLVIDESHEFRSLTADMRSAVAASRSAKHLMLLTGTPQVNSPDDLAGLVALFGEDVSVVRAGGHSHAAHVRWGDTTIEGFAWPMDRLRRLLAGRVSFYAPKIHAADDYRLVYPTVRHVRVKLALSVPQALQYLLARGHLTINAERIPGGGGGGGGEAPSPPRLRFCCPTGNHYKNGQVRACNAADCVTHRSTKADWIARHVRDGSLALPLVVHSAFLEHGLDLVEEALRRSSPTKLRIARITGKVISNRTGIVDRYNSGGIDVLLISKAAATGVSLQGTRSMVLMEAFRNRSTESQTAARVLRMDSHVGGASQVLTIYKLVAIFPMDTLRQAASAPSLRATDRYLADAALEMFGHRRVRDKRFTAQVSGAHLRHQMAAVAEEEEEGKTVNEQFEAINDRKATFIHQFNKVLHRASIDMPRGSLRMHSASTIADVAGSVAKLWSQAKTRGTDGSAGAGDESKAGAGALERLRAGTGGKPLLPHPKWRGLIKTMVAQCMSGPDLPEWSSRTATQWAMYSPLLRQVQQRAEAWAEKARGVRRADAAESDARRRAQRLEGRKTRAQAAVDKAEAALRQARGVLSTQLQEVEGATARAAEAREALRQAWPDDASVTGAAAHAAQRKD